MIAELGNFVLAAALIVAVIQTVFPLLGAQFGIEPWVRIARPAVHAQAFLVLLAYVCLSYLFLNDDFSVRYVAVNSNSDLPIYYKFAAVWGGHEGSLLLWLLMLAGWTFAVALSSRSLPAVMMARVIGVMGFISVGFLLFTVMVSNPFERLFPIPENGQDLNPLLQDPGLVIHPPLLYMGYVGFSIAFAFAIAALISGRLDVLWARWTRPWTLFAWAFLTIGIALGSWWAYHELGWGGWWFWDPVENASFMPWLVGTALIHSLIISEKRDSFKSWTVLLAILAFSLSLLGTFLVRSGVLVSVHAFANDPERGIFILMFLSIVIGISLLLYAWRAPSIRSRGTFSLYSRESLLLINNVFLLVSAMSILFATLYPLFMDAMGLGKISVGPPYFNSVFIPLTLPLVVLAGLGPFLQWQSATAENALSIIKVILPLAVLIGITVPWIGYGSFSVAAVAGVTAGSWVILATLLNLCRRLLKSSTRPSTAFLGMVMAHIGVGVLAIGITLTSVYSIEREVSVTEADAVMIHNYRFVFRGVSEKPGPNYSALQGQIEVFKNERSVAVLYPEKRTYKVQTNPMTEASIDAGLLRDLYVALGEKTANKWSMRIYYRPMIRWIWFGALMIALGGILAAVDRRYRFRQTSQKATEI